MEICMEDNQLQCNTATDWKNTERRTTERKYSFTRGKLDACVYKCQLTGTVLIHHVDDFDVCGPEHVLVDLLTNQLPSKGCKLKMGGLEYPGKTSDRTSEFLGRTKINVEEAAVTKLNSKHIKTILQMLWIGKCEAESCTRENTWVAERQTVVSRWERDICELCRKCNILVSGSTRHKV